MSSIHMIFENKEKVITKAVLSKKIISVTESMKALQMPGALFKAKRGNGILWLKIFQVEAGYVGFKSGPHCFLTVYSWAMNLTL